VIPGLGIAGRGARDQFDNRGMAKPKIDGDALVTRRYVICDGCNVRPPFEHRCHEDRPHVNGALVEGRCECDLCVDPPLAA
jgi:hypothetical protein